MATDFLPLRLLRALLVGFVVIFAEAWAVSDGELLGRWMTFYYQAPEPQRVREAVTAVLAEPAWLAQPERLDPLVHFFAVVARSDPQARRELSAMAKTESVASKKEFIERILHQTGRLEFSSARDPNDLDVAWAHFFATGNLKAVRLVFNALDFKDTEVDLSRLVWRAIGVKDRPEATRLMRSAAAWSLSKNAQAHPKVREFLEKELAQTTVESKKQRLRDILEGKFSLH